MPMMDKGMPPAQIPRVLLVEDDPTSRLFLTAALSALPAVREVLPSAANFLCVRWRDAAGTYARLLAAGIVVRDVTRYPGLHDCLRISVGTPQENQQLLALLRGMAEAA